MVNVDWNRANNNRRRTTTLHAVLSLRLLSTSTATVEEEDEEEEFVLRHVPSSTTHDTNDRILEAWAETAVAPLVGNDDRDSSVRPDAVRQTLSWFASARRKQEHNNKETSSSISTETYNAVLKVLANDLKHESSLDDVQDSEETVEDTALRLLEQMRASPSSTPNTDTFTHRINCVRRSNPIDAVSAAMAILEDMQHADMQPDVETFNAILGWHACINDPASSMESIDQLYEDMTQKNNVQPNRETFQLILLAFTNRIFTGPPGVNFDNVVFDEDYLSSWLDRMVNTLGPESVDHEMLDATFPLLAPHRRTPHWSLVRRMSLRSHWKNARRERASALFPGRERERAAHAINTSGNPQYTLHDDEKAAMVLTDTARQFERWFERASSDKYHGNPSLEAVRAVVAAWVQTRTRDGLVRAEFWAMKALTLSDHDTTNHDFLDVVSPVLWGWALSNNRTGVVRVEEWIAKLEELSEARQTINVVRPIDPNHERIIGAAILGWRKHQKYLHTDKDQDPVLLLEAAEKSTRWLERLCEEGNNALSDGSLFAHVMDCWGDVPGNLFKTRHEGTDTAPSVIPLDRVLKVVKLLNDHLINTSHSINTNNNDVFIVNHVYNTALRIMNRHIGGTKSSNNNINTYSPSTLAVEAERMLFVTDILYQNHKSRMTDEDDNSPNDDSLHAFSHPSIMRHRNNNTNKTHTYSTFYHQLLFTCHATSDSGFAIRTTFGMADRIFNDQSPLYEHNGNHTHHHDDAKLCNAILRNVTRHTTSSSCKQRVDLLGQVVERMLSNNNKPDPERLLKSIKKYTKVQMKTADEAEFRNFLTRTKRRLAR